MKKTGKDLAQEVGFREIIICTVEGPNEEFQCVSFTGFQHHIPLNYQ